MKSPVLEVEIEYAGQQIICDFCYQQDGNRIDVCGFSCRGTSEAADADNSELVQKALTKFREQLRRELGADLHFNFDVLAQHYFLLTSFLNCQSS